jgi:NADPH-dependent F420 reductase
MKVSIIGNGNMANGLALCFAKSGHDVELHVRDTAKGEALQQELTKDHADAKVSVLEMGSPIGDVLIPTVHYGDEMAEVAEQYAEVASGKVVVDITNPVDFNTFQLIPEAGTSGAEEVAKLFPGAKVVKAFNTVFSGALVKGDAGGQPIDVFIAGDDEPAKKTVSELVESSGMRPLDVGSLANARHLEGFELLHMNLQEQVQGNWMSGIKIVS